MLLIVDTTFRSFSSSRARNDVPTMHQLISAIRFHLDLRILHLLSPFFERLFIAWKLNETSLANINAILFNFFFSSRLRSLFFPCFVTKNSIFKRRRHTLWMPGKARLWKLPESFLQARGDTTEKNYNIHKHRSTFVLIALFSDFSFFRRSVFSSLSLPL